MSQIWPQDIESATIARLQDATYGVQAQLDIIDAARSQDTPEILDSSISDERQDENPEVIVDYEDSDIDLYFGSSLEDQIRKNPSVVITAVLNTADRTNIKKYMSNYIEAITKSLTGYSVGNISAFIPKKDMIGDLYREERDTTKFAGVRFELLINGGIE